MTLEQSVTYWLNQWHGGDDGAMDRVTGLIYQDLRRLAGHYLTGERAGHTLQPTALVHEAYLQVSGVRDIDWKARGQFVAVMAQMMRRILIDHARQRNALKRNDAGMGSEFADLSSGATPLDVLLVDQSLERLAKRYPRPARTVELRFFGGLELPEVARVLDVSLATVERDWRFAKAWLKRELAGT